MADEPRKKDTKSVVQEVLEKKKDPKAHLWKKGQSGNPRGKMKGAMSPTTALRKKHEELRAQLLVHDGARVLHDQAVPIAKEVILIAMQPDTRPYLETLKTLVGQITARGKAQDKEKEELVHDVNRLCREARMLWNALDALPNPSPAKVKCLGMCMDRLIPTLKVVEVAPAGTGMRKAAEMTDDELMDMMARMVDMAQQGRGEIEHGRIDG
jgi:hypothetical protein